MIGKMRRPLGRRIVVASPVCASIGCRLWCTLDASQDWLGTLLDENLDVFAVFFIQNVDNLADFAGIDKRHQLVHIQAFHFG